MDRPITSILETQQEQNQYFKDNYSNSFQRTMMLARDLKKKVQMEYEEKERVKKLKRYNTKNSDPVQIKRVIIK